MNPDQYLYQQQQQPDAMHGYENQMFDRRNSMMSIPDYNYQTEEPARKSSVSKSGSTKLYALRIASTPGIYSNWNLAKSLIDGCPGAKYKGFFTVEECMQFIWEQFPASTFTKNEQGDYIMDDPEPVYHVIEEARLKKEKNSGLMIEDDLSTFDPKDPQCTNIVKLYSLNPDLKFALNEEQLHALNLIRKSENVFISGGKYTGKDVLLAHVYEFLAHSKKYFHITTASVITSLNSPINHTLGWTGMGKALGTKKQILSKVRKNTQARKWWADTDVIIVKDASLMSAFLLDIMDFLGKEIRKDTRPFGGIQMILVGDSHGLNPPNVSAVCCPNCGQTHRIGGINFTAVSSTPGSFITCNNDACGTLFLNTWILYPFEASCWDEANFYYLKLKRSYEQDANLAALYTELTRQPPISENARQMLLSARRPVSDQTVYICPTFEESQKMNEQKLQELSGDSLKYEAQDTVLNNFDFSSRAQQKDGPTDEILWLKREAKVLFVDNHQPYTQLGVVVGFVQPTPEDLKQALSSVAGKNMKMIETSITDWLNKYSLLPQVRILSTGEIKTVTCKAWVVRSNRRAVAWRIQLPIRLAYSVALHRSQDLQLSSLTLAPSMEWASGQMYMALLLAKSYESICIESFNENSFLGDKRVLEFEAAAKEGTICKGVKSNTLPENFLSNPNMSLKRNSVVSLQNANKKRRPSKPMVTPMSSAMGMENTMQMPLNDPLLLRYQQQLSQRRHSYQPLTSYQEQQYAWMASQAPMMNHGMPPQVNNQNLQPNRQSENVMNHSPNLMHSGQQPLHTMAIPEHFPNISQKEYQMPIRTKITRLETSIPHAAGPKSAGTVGQSFMYNQMGLNQQFLHPSLVKNDSHLQMPIVNEMGQQNYQTNDINTQNPPPDQSNGYANPTNWQQWNQS
ncbi:hypothetical protein HDV06_003593 [Boothiomyces sp. JEL0866]|nr:hypothetical protein HDV06_003593 [Boothiomyces sp. JEL0866]